MRRVERGRQVRNNDLLAANPLHFLNVRLRKFSGICETSPFFSSQPEVTKHVSLTYDVYRSVTVAAVFEAASRGKVKGGYFRHSVGKRTLSSTEERSGRKWQLDRPLEQTIEKSPRQERENYARAPFLLGRDFEIEERDDRRGLYKTRSQITIKNSASQPNIATAPRPSEAGPVELHHEPADHPEEKNQKQIGETILLQDKVGSRLAKILVGLLFPSDRALSALHHAYLFLSKTNATGRTSVRGAIRANRVAAANRCEAANLQAYVVFCLTSTRLFAIRAER